MTGAFGQGDLPLIIAVTGPDRYNSPRTLVVVSGIIDQLNASGHVAAIASAWTSPPPAGAALLSRDQRTGLIITGVVGTESRQQAYTKELAGAVVGDHNGVAVRAGGAAMVNLQITEQSKRNLLVLEAIVIPLSFVVFIWVFGGLFAAALPLVVGVLAILGSLAVLRAITFVTDVSILALDLTTAMGLALGIDYTLLIVSRYRDELASQMPGAADRRQAISTTMVTAGRTVLFSAVTVALCMAVMVLFPMNFLRYFAYAGVACVGFAALAAVVVAFGGAELLVECVLADAPQDYDRRWRGMSRRYRVLTAGLLYAGGIAPPPRCLALSPESSISWRTKAG